MVMRTAQELKLEVVLFGFRDTRLSSDVRVGFALRCGPYVSVHQRTDIDALLLPELFAFTTKSLSELIIQAVRENDPSSDLHELLLKTVFGGLGSFRCWAPQWFDLASPLDVPGYVDTFKQHIDHEMNKHFVELQAYSESCTPAGWRQLPEIAPAVALPV